MNKQERLTYYREMDQLISQMEKEDQKKFEFVKKFFKNELKIKSIEDSRITVEPMELKSFLFLIFSILVKYDMSKN